MIETLLPALVLVAMFFWLMYALHKPPSLLRHLAHELGKRGHLPVYSAETVHGKEAEFIRDRLPIKAGRTLLLVLAMLALMLALFWLVTR